VFLSDVNMASGEDEELGFSNYLDVLDHKTYRKYVVENRIDWILHLPALLSATCEANIGLAMQINVESSHIAFRIADEFGCKLFIPSSIGAFGPASPLEAVPDVCYQRPHTYYGVSKVYTEMLGEYYHVKRGMDFRCLRYPGIISAIAEPGGGTTDYAVDIYKQIIGGKKQFECYLEPDARLPMMLEDDCVKGTCDFMATDAKNLTKQTYNLGALDFTPSEVAENLKKKYDFEMVYNVDPLRQDIANKWPKVFLSDGASKDWGWQPEYDSLDKMTDFMIENVPV